MKTKRMVRRVSGVVLGMIVGCVTAATASDAASKTSAAGSDDPTVEAIEPPAPPGEAPPGEAASERRISVDFKDADIRQVLRVISMKSEVDIVAGPDVEGLVTIKLTDVPWEQALELILRTYGFTYERKDKVIRVMSLQAVEQEALATEVISLNYAKAKDVTDVLKEMLSDRGKVKYDDRTNTVILTDMPTSLFQLKQVIARLDQQTPQVHIESRFVETRLTRDENLGIDWYDSMTGTLSPATSSTTFPFPAGGRLGGAGQTLFTRPGNIFYTGTSAATNAAATRGVIPTVGGQFVFGTLTMSQLQTTINMLKQRVDTKVINNPTIVTLNNQEASVQIGTDVNIPNFQVDPSTGRATVTGFQTRSTGTILKVTPHINLQDEIVIDVKPEITTVSSTAREYASGVSFPDFNVQKAQTQVRLVNGQTLVIGGLKRQAEAVTVSKIPILGDIPIVGALFTNRREQTPSGQDQLDLLIFLTVHLMKDKSKGTQQTALVQPAGP